MMKNGALIALAWSVLSVVAVAQEKPAESPKSEATPTRKESVEALKKEYTETEKKVFAELDKLKTDDEKVAYYRKNAPSADEFAKRLFVIVDADPKDEASAEALSWIVQRANGEVMSKALDMMKEHHVLSKSIGQVCMTFVYQANAEMEALMRRVLADNPHVEAKGLAAYALSKSLTNLVAMHRRLADPARTKEEIASLKEYNGGDAWYDWVMKSDIEKATAEAESLLVRCTTDFKDVPMRKSTLGETATRDIFEAKNLAIGKTAPEITGEDVDGVKFKLSDYRGKVVVLDFWGFW